MKLVHVFVLQILLSMTHLVPVCSNFMEKLVSLVKETSINHTDFDLKKLFNKSDESDGLNKQKMVDNLTYTGKSGAESNRTINDKVKMTDNNTSVLQQMQNNSNLNTTKNSPITLQTLHDENNCTIIEKRQESNSTNLISLLLSLTSNHNSTKNGSITISIQDRDTIVTKSKDNINTSIIPLQLSKNLDNSSTNSSIVTSDRLETIKEMKNKTDEMYIADEELHAFTPISSAMDRARWNIMMRDSFRRRQREEIDEPELSSSSRELMSTKEEFDNMWKIKKFQALNNSKPMGDKVNMFAARPWGTPCGDPAQHDMTWGECMLQLECEPEFRIYRGDLYCGRTQFVCCAVQISTYNLYQGFDLSNQESDYNTGSEEQARGQGDRGKDSKKKKMKERRERKRDRERNVLKIKKGIQRIIKEIKKILHKQFSNRTLVMKAKVLALKRYVKKLKRQFKKDRKKARNLNMQEQKQMDEHLMKTMTDLKIVNKDFVNNATFRDIVINGSITREGARLLLQTYPELDEYVDTRRRARRMMSSDVRDGDLMYELEYEYY